MRATQYPPCKESPNKSTVLLKRVWWETTNAALGLGVGNLSS